MLKPKQLGRGRASFVEMQRFQAGKDHGPCLAAHPTGEPHETGRLPPPAGFVRGILGSFFAGHVLPLQWVGGSEKWKESVVKW